MVSQSVTSLDDKVLHLKDFPGDLHSQLKSNAALEGIKLREYVIAVLRRVVEAQQAKRSDSRRSA